MQGKIVIQERLKHAVMNRPRRAALGNSEPPFTLPAGGPAPALPLSGGAGRWGSSPLKPPGPLPPSFCFLGALGGPWSGRLPPAWLPELPQAVFTRGKRHVSPFSPVLARTGAEVGNETPAKGRFIVP